MSTISGSRRSITSHLLIWKRGEEKSIKTEANGRSLPEPSQSSQPRVSCFYGFFRGKRLEHFQSTSKKYKPKMFQASRYPQQSAYTATVFILPAVYMTFDSVFCSCVLNAALRLVWCKSLGSTSKYEDRIVLLQLSKYFCRTVFHACTQRGRGLTWKWVGFHQFKWRLCFLPPPPCRFVGWFVSRTEQKLLNRVP